MFSRHTIVEKGNQKKDRVGIIIWCTPGWSINWSYTVMGEKNFEIGPFLPFNLLFRNKQKIKVKKLKILDLSH